MTFLKNETFTIGCNYLASNAGTEMWKEWDPRVVEEDFNLLSQHNIHMLRVFPIWPDFQPILAGYKVCGELQEIRLGQDPLPGTPEGENGVSEEALEKFEQLCRLADKYDMHFIVGLVTGWMSGRLFVPRALEGKKLLTDPMAIKWQARFVRTFVKRFAHKECISAWDLGNECNCLGTITDPDELYVWASVIAGAIRCSDPERPIISGMHALRPEGMFRLKDHAELVDILSTHPYPLFTPYCDGAPVNTMLPELHGTCETLLYRGLGRKPCFVEETGTLGPCIADEETSASFGRTCMFSLWAHNCLGFMWWCSFDQNFAYPPYDWRADERELGIFRGDGSPKSILIEMERFSHFLDSFEYKELPRRIVDGVCILSRNQDTWANAFMSFVLAKQAGIDLEFAYCDQPLPKAEMYFLPGVCSDGALFQREMTVLLERVYKGASLYISLDSGMMASFDKITGIHIISRERAQSEEMLIFKDDEVHLPISVRYCLHVKPVGAEVLATDARGEPVISSYRYGRGLVYCVFAPVEVNLAGQPGRIEDKPPYHTVYERFLSLSCTSRKVARVRDARIGLTEHELAKGRRLLVMINYTPEAIDTQLDLKSGWQISRFIRGSLSIMGNDASVCEIILQEM